MADQPFWMQDQQVGPQSTSAQPAAPSTGLHTVFSQPPNPNDTTRTTTDVAAENRQQQANTWSVIPPDDPILQTLPRGPTYQRNGLGEIKTIGDVKAAADPRQSTLQAIKTLGVDLTDPNDRISKLILQSTSGKLQHKAADFVGSTFGSATSGMQAIGKLQTDVSDLVLQMTGGGLGNQVSDADREFMQQRAGDIANPDIPADQRLAAWQEVKGRMARILGVQVPSSASGSMPAVTANDNTTPPGSTPGNPGGTTADVTGAAARANGITFGPQDTGPFDRNAYLQKTYGVSADQEAALVGDWNAVSGNKNLTVDQGRQIYQSVGLPPPDDATLQQQVMNARKGASFQGIDTAAAEKAYTDQLDAAIKARGDNPESFGETAGINLGQGVTLNGLDELAGLGGAVRALAQGDNPVAGYQAERDIQRREQDRSEAAHPIAAPVFNVAGGALTAPIAFGDANTVAGAVKAGAALGGVAGFNSGEGAGGSLTGALTGAATGAALGAGGAKVSDALASRAAAKAAANAAPSEGADTLAAAGRLNDQFGTNIQPMPADVSGPGIRNVTGGMAKFPASAQPIIAGAKKVAAEAEKARNAIAATVGNASATPDAAGETALNGALSYIKSSRTKVDALYAKARQLGGTAPVDLANARAALDQNIAELSQTPGGAPALTELKALRAELDKPYPVEGVRQMRTVLRDRFMGDGLRSTDLERRVGQVVDAAQQDVVNSLEAAGKDEAAQAYATAANAHSARVGLIDNVLEPIIGKNGDKSAEQVFQALSNATKTKGAQLGKFLGALPKDDAATVRATLIGRLGEVPAGQQNAAGDAFSLPAFLTHWNQMSATAKTQLFGGETRAALDDLAQVAQGTKEAQRFANFSNTGGVVGIASTGAMSAAAFSSPLSVAAGLVAQYGGGRLLASPRFARWLVKMPKDPAAAAAHVRSLSKIATADASIAPDILGLQQRLMEAFSGPTKLAAQPNSGTSTTGGAQQ